MAVIELFYGGKLEKIGPREASWKGTKDSYKIEDGETLSIGRLGDIKIPENHINVSRYHGKFENVDGNIYYTDDSKFGTAILNNYVHNKGDCLIYSSGNEIEIAIEPDGRLEYLIQRTPEDNDGVIHHGRTVMENKMPVLFFGEEKVNWRNPFAFVKY